MTLLLKIPESKKEENKSKSFTVLSLLYLLAHKDSNLDKQDQNLLTIFYIFTNSLAFPVLYITTFNYLTHFSIKCDGLCDWAENKFLTMT